MRVSSPENALPGHAPARRLRVRRPRRAAGRRRWPGERGLVDAWLARRGFATARIDGRGVVGRGHASENASIAGRTGRGRAGKISRAACATLFERSRGSTRRGSGIWGWSYGGYMTLMALFRAPRRVRRPASRSRRSSIGAATIRTTPSAILGLPLGERRRLRRQLGAHVRPTACGHISTLVHGTGDDNVHFRESMLLVDQLVERASDFRPDGVSRHAHDGEPRRADASLYALVGARSWRSWAGARSSGRKRVSARRREQRGTRPGPLLAPRGVADEEPHAHETARDPRSRDHGAFDRP